MVEWPKGKTGLISGRLDDPDTTQQPGHVLEDCFNCGRQVRVGLLNQQIARDRPCVVVCVQCWHQYYESGMTMIVIRPLGPDQTVSQPEEEER